MRGTAAEWRCHECDAHGSALDPWGALILHHAQAHPHKDN